MQTVHKNIRDFKCQYCSNKFPRKRDLEVHIQTVHKKIAKYCNEKDLEKHIARHHTKEEPKANGNDITTKSNIPQKITNFT